MTNLILNWKQAWHFRAFRIQSIITLFAGIVLILSAPRFLNFIQTIKGTYLKDILLNLIPAHDLSWYIFILLYTAILLAVSQLSSQPILLLKALQAYILMTFLRAGSIYFFPLEPDQHIIPLVDPLIDYFFYQQTVITKDLFFSGHVSTLALLCFVIPSSLTRKIAVGITIVVAFFILIQHVHYTIDILVAPIAAWVAYYLVSLYPAPIIVYHKNKS